jgi:hypothetical protein
MNFSYIHVNKLKCKRDNIEVINWHVPMDQASFDPSILRDLKLDSVKINKEVEWIIRI